MNRRTFVLPPLLLCALAGWTAPGPAAMPAQDAEAAADTPHIEIPVCSAATTPPEADGVSVVRLDIDAAGVVRSGDNVLFDPAKEGEGKIALQEWLHIQASRMDKHFNEAIQLELPNDVLLIRADRSAPMRTVLRVMEVCGHHDIQIWRIRLAARSAPEAPEGFVPIDLPFDVDFVEEPEPLPPGAAQEVPPTTPREVFEVSLRGEEPGETIPVEGAGRHDFEGRQVEYRIGLYRTREGSRARERITQLYEDCVENGPGGRLPNLSIDASPAVVGDVTPIMGAALGAGCPQVTFIGFD